MISRIQNNVLFATFRQVKDILGPKERISLYLQVLLTVAGGFLEVAGLAMLVPMIVIAQDPSLIHSNSFLSGLYEGMGFGSDNVFLIVMVLFVLLVFILKNLFSLFIIWRQTNFAFQIAQKLSEREYWKYLDRGYLYVKDKGSIQIIYNIFTIPGLFGWGVVLPYVTILSEMAVLMFILFSIAVYNVTLLVALFAFLLPAALLTYNSTKNRLFDLGKDRERHYKVTYDILNRAVFGYTDMKLAAKESVFLQRYLSEFSKLNNTQKIQSFLSYLPSRSLEIFAVLGIVVIFCYTLLIAKDNSKLLEFLGVFAAAAFRVMPSMNRVLMALMSVKNHQYTFDTLKEKENSQEDGRAQLIPVEFNESIEFSNIRFKYEGAGAEALSGVGFKVMKGEKIGIIGESGSGKTTLMTLLLRFVEESSGNILVDGKVITKEKTKGLRALIGYVQQDVFLIDADLRQNIAFGEREEEINEAALQSAIDQASLRKFIDSLPLGLKTRVGELGSKLSGGQKQRFGIARALYKNSQILVFDEATSALDIETEREVTEAIDYLSGKDKTIFVIAHRITTLRGCDRIIELKNGAISGIWQYDELIRDRIK